MRLIHGLLAVYHVWRAGRLSSRYRWHMARRDRHLQRARDLARKGVAA